MWGKPGWVKSEHTLEAGRGDRCLMLAFDSPDAAEGTSPLYLEAPQLLELKKFHFCLN